jgi:hypothetical protein
VARTARLWEVILFVCVSCSIAAHATTCDVTQPNGNTPPGEQPDNKFYGNGSLWTVLWWPGGTLTYPPGEPGDHTRGRLIAGQSGLDSRSEKGKLTIQGRRLDAHGSPLRAWIPEGYGDIGFQVAGVIFPTPGCWEVTGRVQETRLTFVVNVVRKP